MQEEQKKEQGAGKKNLYVYPCEESNDCVEFLEGYQTMSFAEFCETVCGSGCPHCVYMDIPYTKEMLEK